MFQSGAHKLTVVNTRLIAEDTITSLGLAGSKNGNIFPRMHNWVRMQHTSNASKKYLTHKGN